MLKRKLSLLVILLIVLARVTVGAKGELLVEQEATLPQAMTDQQLASAFEEELAQTAQQALRSAFIENQGQVANEEIVYYGHLANGKIGFGRSKVFLWWAGWASVVTLYFADARAVNPIGAEMLETKSNFFLGDRGTSYMKIKNFEIIIYHDLWEGIDLYYKATSEGVKYEFRVASGANPADITIHCEGQDFLSITPRKVILLKDERQFVDEGLAVFQADGRKVDAAIIAKGQNTFGFQIANYNNQQPLIIDPLLYSTFVGGGEMDGGCSLALDGEGNAYVTGWTSSNDFPTTATAYNQSYNDDDGYRDCFVCKLSADGSSLLYSTFVGGSDDDGGLAIVLDDEGNAYVTGGTKSSNFPTTVNAYNRTYGGEHDCFVCKLSADGSSLLYSTFVGRSSYDVGWSLALDSEGNAYVTGGTESSNFPTTTDAYDDSYNGGSDCFVFKLASDGSALLYSTYVGGNGYDYGDSLILDGEGNVHGTGYTSSSDFPTTRNAYNRTYGGGWSDCFVFKLSADGSSLLYSTFVGGSNLDKGYSLALDNQENEIMVCGTTSSSNFPTTNDAYNRTFSGVGDCFVFKLSADGSSLLYSTFVGGSDHDSGNSLALDSYGNVVVAGMTMSSNFPTTENAYDNSYNDAEGTFTFFSDCFIFKLSTDDSSLLYSTFIGGLSGDALSSNSMAI